MAQLNVAPLINRLRLMPDQPVEGVELCPECYLMVIVAHHALTTCQTSSLNLSACTLKAVAGARFCRVEQAYRHTALTGCVSATQHCVPILLYQSMCLLLWCCGWLAGCCSTCAGHMRLSR